MKPVIIKVCLPQYAVEKGIREILADIVRDDKRARDIITNLRRMLRGDPPQDQQVSLEEVTRELLDFMGDELDRNSIAVQIVSKGEVPDVCGGHVAIQQVIMNLITNAACFACTIAGGANSDGTCLQLADGWCEIRCSLAHLAGERLEALRRSHPDDAPTFFDATTATALGSWWTPLWLAPSTTSTRAGTRAWASTTGANPSARKASSSRWMAFSSFLMSVVPISVVPLKVIKVDWRHAPKS